MRPLRAALVVMVLVTASTHAEAKIPRNAAAIAEFKRQQPCPSTSKARGKCPGWIVDHVKPLCAGGPDAPANMQWQTITDAKAKDQLERRECAKH